MEFADPSVHEFPIPLTSKSTTLDSLTLSLIEIDITPIGHDRWIFDYKLSLTFDDGETYTTGELGVILDQDNRRRTGVFQ